MAETKGSGASMGGIDLSVAKTGFDVLDENTSPAGGTREDHFQPGVSVGSSRRERIRSLVFFSSGRSRRVIENPGMFKLVFIVVGDQPVGYCQAIPPTHHESPGDKPLNWEAFCLKLTQNFSGNTSEFEFAESSEVVHQSDYLILTFATERNVASVLVFGRGYHRDELVDEVIHGRDRGYTFVSCFVVNSHTDFNFIPGEVGFGCGGTGNLERNGETSKTCKCRGLMGT